ncbi:MAG TPA: hypothetical protein VNJ07_00535 [Chitinophagales bacterium]|nr:hypothetical protein [Chitinophagales bacterium]
MVFDVFNNLPDDARVWIYQCSRELDETEVKQVSALIRDFVHQWTSHSRKVIAAGEVVYHRFIILAADESAFPVSGCSIDFMTHFIRQLEEQFHLNLFDRLTIAYRENGSIRFADQISFLQMIAEGSVKETTIVFNNLVPTLKDLRENWEVPLSKSWHVRFLQK